MNAFMVKLFLEFDCTRDVRSTTEVWFDPVIFTVGKSRLFVFDDSRFIKVESFRAPHKV